MIRAAVTLAALLAAAPTAHAYVLRDNDATGHDRWPGTLVDLYLDPTLQQNDDVKAAIIDAINGWNATPAQMHIRARLATTPYRLDNGRNEITWIARKADLGDRPGRAFYYYAADGTLDECDVLLAADWGFTTSEHAVDLRNYGPGNKRSLRGLTLHELGHFLGLGHEDDVYNIMGDDASHAHANGPYVFYNVGEDAAAGAVALYGADRAVEDLAVSHWHWSGSFDGYSSHARNRIFLDDGVTLAPRNAAGQYVLTRGTSYKLEVTLENNGADAQTTTVRYLLSSNDIISISDTVLRTIDGFHLTAAEPTTYRAAGFSIASSTAPGDYWIGAWIDPLHVLAEHDEGNNRGAILPVRVQ